MRLPILLTILLSFCLVSNVYAQEEMPPAEESASISLEDLQAAIDATCDCNTDEEAAAEEGETEDKVAPGRCISKISKLRAALKTMTFFGLTDAAAADVRSLVKENKKACRGNKGKKNKGKKGDDDDDSTS